MLEFLSITLMILFVLTRNRIVGCIAWISFSLVWLLKAPMYYEIKDYYNLCLVLLAFLFFLFLGITIFKSERISTFIDVTRFSALSALFYYIFALTTLKDLLIYIVTTQTVSLANMLGYPFQAINHNIIELNDKMVEIILACTGIESMALFAGATLGVNAELGRKVKAFLISVPVIYVLNLFRNVFVVSAYGYSWFGENSFYIAHHVISKILATIALILISLAVFRILPELADLINDLKDEMVEVWRSDRKERY
ncbi:MAG TPA: archaeosortase A [Archaeoglobus profundus]|nr:archaeosortase A [Archaeoglobus profundus]